MPKCLLFPRVWTGPVRLKLLKSPLFTNVFVPVAGEQEVLPVQICFKAFTSFWEPTAELETSALGKGFNESFTRANLPEM